MFPCESVQRTCRYLGLFGYALEWLLEAKKLEIDAEQLNVYVVKACHSSSKLHTMLHRINTPKASCLDANPRC